MSGELTHAERVRRLVDDPGEYQTLVADYGSDKKVYNKARRKAPSTLETFEEYLELFRIFIEYGPTELVFCDLKRNTERSLKNRILRDSKAGHAYPIYTLKDVQTWLEKYSELGFTPPDLGEVVETTVEHIYTEGEFASFSYEIASSLLSSTPDNHRESVEFLPGFNLLMVPTI